MEMGILTYTSFEMAQTRCFSSRLKETGALDFADVTAGSGLGDAGNGESAVFADIDLDGTVDCYVVNRSGSNALYLNDGHGAFTRALDSGAELGGICHGGASADFNNDGYPDLYV